MTRILPHVSVLVFSAVLALAVHVALSSECLLAPFDLAIDLCADVGTFLVKHVVSTQDVFLSVDHNLFVFFLFLFVL